MGDQTSIDSLFVDYVARQSNAARVVEEDQRSADSLFFSSMRTCRPKTAEYPARQSNAATLAPAEEDQRSADCHDVGCLARQSNAAKVVEEDQRSADSLFVSSTRTCR